jgi:hypothetical protein
MMQFALAVTVLPLPGVRPERNPPAKSRFPERPPFNSWLLLACDVFFSVVLKEKYGK